MEKEDIGKIFKEVCESRVPVYCKYEKSKIISGINIPGYVRHHPFYKSVGTVFYTPLNHNPQENIFDYCIVCTKEEHSILEDISRYLYGLKSDLTEWTYSNIDKLTKDSSLVNKIIEDHILKQLEWKEHLSKYRSEMLNKRWKNAEYRAYMSNKAIEWNKNQWNNKEFIEFQSDRAINQ